MPSASSFRIERGRADMDMNTAKLKKNAFRVTQERGKTASRIRIPGGHMDARFLAII